MVLRIPAILQGGKGGNLAELETIDRATERLHAAIVSYLGRLSQESRSTQQTQMLYGYIAIADTVGYNFCSSGKGNAAFQHEA